MASVDERIIDRPANLPEMVEHLEIDHERELAGPQSFRELQMTHGAMHRRRAWAHTHRR